MKFVMTAYVMMVKLSFCVNVNGNHGCMSWWCCLRKFGVEIWMPCIRVSKICSFKFLNSNLMTLHVWKLRDLEPSPLDQNMVFAVVCITLWVPWCGQMAPWGHTEFLCLGMFILLGTMAPYTCWVPWHPTILSAFQVLS